MAAHLPGCAAIHEPEDKTDAMRGTTMGQKKNYKYICTSTNAAGHSEEELVR